MPAAFSPNSAPLRTRGRAIAKSNGLAGLCAALALLAGCQATLPRNVQAEDPPGANAELMEYISNLQYVTADAGFRAIYILATREVFDGSYDALVAALESRGLKPPHLEARRLLTRAEVGALVARAADIRTGLNWQLTGLGRYAWRELIYRGIARTEGEMAYISGGEFLGVLARAEEYVNLRKQGAGVELGKEP